MLNMSGDFGPASFSAVNVKTGEIAFQDRSFPKISFLYADGKLVMLDAAESLDDLRVPPGNRLEKLSGKRTGQHSIRINDQWRLCFVWQEDGPHEVEIVDYH